VEFEPTLTKVFRQFRQLIRHVLTNSCINVQKKFNVSASMKIFKILNLKFQVCLVGLIFLSACNTRPLPPANFSAPDWKIQQGQAVWRAKKTAPEIAGELLLARNSDGRTVVQFTKTPFPFVIAQTTTNSWQLEVPAQNRKYSGAGKPPARVSWFHLLNALNGIPQSKPWIFRKLENGNWRLENKTSGEMIEGYLTP
jgi:hypothetical protein